MYERFLNIFTFANCLIIDWVTNAGGWDRKEHNFWSKIVPNLGKEPTFRESLQNVSRELS